ncbi:MAG: hypothetical protein J6S82_00085, partial [Bacteroidales bacterium]|nr:hypothetical protein [Bacteroidales bacterium]
MNIIGIIIWSVCGIWMILFFYLIILDVNILAILKENKIKANHFSIYFSYRIFKYFIEKNEFEDSVRMKYIKLYKKAIWTKRILLYGVLSFILFPI